MTDYSKLPRVIHLIDEYTFVINRGKDSDGMQGDNYLIFRLGQSIFDPTTGDDLGVLEVVIGRARATHVQEKISTLESTIKQVVPGQIRRITRQSGGFISSFVPAEEEIEEGKEVRRMPIDVQLGDYARPV